MERPVGGPSPSKPGKIGKPSIAPSFRISKLDLHFELKPCLIGILTKKKRSASTTP